MRLACRVSVPSRPWRSHLTRLLAELVYLSRAPLVLFRPTLTMLALCAVGAWVHYFYGIHEGAEATWREAFYVSYSLLLLEPLARPPHHPLAQLMGYLQPLLGIFVVSEGVIKLGIKVFRKEDNARQWMGIMASLSKDHVILCGLGTVGFRVLEQLVAMRVPVFCIERDPDGEFVARARDLGAEVLIGDARAEGMLRDLKVRRARAVIVATDDDLANLEIAMDARELAPDVHIVMRLFDQRLAQRVKSTLGIQVSVSTSLLAAPLFAAAAMDGSVVSTHRLGDRTMIVMEVDVGPGLAGRCAAEVSRDWGVTLLGVTRGSSTWEAPPPEGRRLTVMDRVQVLVDSARMDELRRRNLGQV